MVYRLCCCLAWLPRVVVVIESAIPLGLVIDGLTIIVLLWFADLFFMAVLACWDLRCRVLIFNNNETNCETQTGPKVKEIGTTTFQLQTSTSRHSTCTHKYRHKSVYTLRRTSLIYFATSNFFHSTVVPQEFSPTIIDQSTIMLNTSLGSTPIETGEFPDETANKS